MSKSRSKTPPRPAPAPSKLANDAVIGKIARDVVEGFQRIAPLLADLDGRVRRLEAPSMCSPTMTVAVRCALLASIARDVSSLVESGRVRELESLLEDAGYLNNVNGRSAEQLAAAIAALAPVLEERYLENAAHSAAWHRYYRQKSDYERANERADEALRAAGVDVEACNARYAAAEAKLEARIAAAEDERNAGAQARRETRGAA